MDKLTRINRLKEEELLVDETIFSVANGFLGTRGTFVEGYGKDFEYNQTYLNGLYDYYDYHYEENLTGFPQRGQKFVNIIDGQKIEFLVNNVPLNISNCEVLSLKREYDLEKGLTLRTIHYKTNEGFVFILKETKFVSAKYKELIVVKVELESLTYDGVITVKSYLKESLKKEGKTSDPRIHNSFVKHLQITDILVKEKTILSKTSESDLYLSSSIKHDSEFTYEHYNHFILGKRDYSISPSNKISLTKYIIHTSSLYNENYKERSSELTNELSNITFEDLVQYQTEYYNEFWDKSYIKVSGENEIESLLNYNLYQLNSSGGESDIHNISAKGLSGEGYEGHYFWDTEIYLIPYFTLTNPQKAKNLLMYRYKNLEGARLEAQNLGYSKGVKIPWRTINGDETSPYYPAGSAQFHINSDISYAVIKYYEVTNDLEFMVNYGFEIMLETARFLAEAVNYIDGVYHLNGVTGPDEYTTIVNDNYYTNSLLEYHFEYLVDFYNSHNSELADIIKKLELSKDEINSLKSIAKHINLPFNKKLNIYAQDSSFLSKKKLDLNKIPKHNFPLLLNYNPLYIYKHQVLKQADSLLSMMLLDFDEGDILRDSYDYYEPITTHDSSLSKCIHSIIAFKLNDFELGCSYFESVLETDYYNTHKNTSHGLHVANLGGSYLGFVYGVLGLRIHKDYISINPKTSNKINGYELSIVYQGNKITFKVGAKLEITAQNVASLRIYGEDVIIKGSYKTDLN